jgi:4-hydroxybenzoate polyprenyltransferase
MVLSSLGILATIVAVGFHKWYLILANAGCVLLLWLYSTSLKKQVLIGNIVVSLLTAWTVVIIFLFTIPLGVAITGGDQSIAKFLRITILYTAFAFIISLIREALKDIEDMKGDMNYGCKTLPIVAGVVATKIYIGVWTVVLLAALIILQLYIIQFGWWWAIIYTLLFIVIPLIGLLFKLQKASHPVQFGYLSSISKRIMLAGILSMIFFKLYF